MGLHLSGRGLDCGLDFVILAVDRLWYHTGICSYETKEKNDIKC
jgi:hypothetical protein